MPERTASVSMCCRSHLLIENISFSKHTGVKPRPQLASEGDLSTLEVWTLFTFCIFALDSYTCFVYTHIFFADVLNFASLKN